MPADPKPDPMDELRRALTGDKEDET